jgi:peptidyl-tRNA hydrolase, PTH1 family
MQPPWLVAGLGNPGRRYEKTRHNAGARAAEQLASSLGLKLKPSKLRALVAETQTEGTRLIIARPHTYMNESGESIHPLTRYYNVEPGHLIVIHDDIDLPVAALKLKFGGSTAGNHGLDSIVDSLKTKDFYRIRIGVGRPPIKDENIDYLLDRMPKSAAAELAPTEESAAEAALSIIHEGLDTAANKFNS